MVRHFVKSQVWTNAEDVLLQAAITKYGLHAWSKVSSMIPGKTPPECKARWYEYLSPAIKKDEWTSEEDATLLQLSRALPNQWQTIAAQLHRTAQKCIERFTYLSNLALGRDVAPNRGLYDHNNRAENKAARPDAKNLGETELEMIQTAEARIANVQGKKGKRRLREKQLQDAKDMAKLARIRQLRAAGVDVKAYQQEDADLVNPLVRLPGQDRNAVFDTAGERQQEKAELAAATFIGKKVSEIEGMSRQQRMLLEKHRLMEKEEQMKRENLPQYIMAKAQLNEGALLKERESLSMPAASSITNLLDRATGQSTVGGIGTQTEQYIDHDTRNRQTMLQLQQQNAEFSLFDRRAQVVENNNNTTTTTTTTTGAVIQPGVKTDGGAGVKRKYQPDQDDDDDLRPTMAGGNNTSTTTNDAAIQHQNKKQKTTDQQSMLDVLLDQVNNEVGGVGIANFNPTAVATGGGSGGLGAMLDSLGGLNMGMGGIGGGGGGLDLGALLDQQLSTLPTAPTSTTTKPTTTTKDTKSTLDDLTDHQLISHVNTNTTIHASSSVLKRMAQAQFVNVSALDIDTDLKQKIIEYQMKFSRTQQQQQNNNNTNSTSLQGNNTDNLLLNAQPHVEQLPIPSQLDASYKIPFILNNLNEFDIAKENKDKENNKNNNENVAKQLEITPQQQEKIEALLQHEFINVMKEKMTGDDLLPTGGNRAGHALYDDVTKVILQNELKQMLNAGFATFYEQQQQEQNTQNRLVNLDDTNMSDNTNTHKPHIPQNPEEYFVHRVQQLADQYTEYLQSTSLLNLPSYTLKSQNTDTDSMNDNDTTTTTSSDDNNTDNTANLHNIVLLNPKTKQYAVLQNLFPVDNNNNNNNNTEQPQQQLQNQIITLRQEALRVDHWLQTDFIKSSSNTTNNKPTAYQKLLKQISRQFDGYVKVITGTSTKIAENHTKYQQALHQYHNFVHLLQNEQKAIHHRTEQSYNTLESVKTKHQQLQQLYVNSMDITE